MSERLVGSPKWRELVEEPAAFVPYDVLRRLSSGDIAELIQLFETGSEAERLVAVGILRTLAGRRSELAEIPWTDDARIALTRAVAEKTRAYYEGLLPWAEAPGHATRILWQVLDPAGLLSFLLSQPLESLPPPMQTDAIRSLAGLAREHPSARERLDRAAAAVEDLSIRIRDELEFVGLPTQDRIDHWSRRWRESKDPEALSWLYHNWLSFLPKGYPVDQLLAVLGPPDEGELPDLYFMHPAGHVYIEASQKTGFSGCHQT